MDPNYSAAELLDPATCLSFQQRDQTTYFLVSAILRYNLQKFLRGKTYKSNTRLRVMGLSVGCKEAPNQ